jgi:hypothetical protein
MAMRMGLRLRALGGGRCTLGRQDGRYREDAGDGVDRLFSRLSERLQSRSLLWIDLDGEGHMPALDCQAANHAQRNQVSRPVWTRNTPEALKHLGFGHICHP